MPAASVDLAAQIVNVRVTRNDGWSLHITLQDPAGVPIDLTGRTIAAQLRDLPDSVDFTALTVTPVNLALGQFTVGQAAAVKGGCYDIQVTTAGVPRTYVRGDLVVQADVTRP